MRQNQKGFSLIEIIMVLAIIAVLASIVAPRGVAVIVQAREVAVVAATHESKIEHLRAVIHYAEDSSYAITDDVRED